MELSECTKNYNYFTHIEASLQPYQVDTITVRVKDEENEA